MLKYFPMVCSLLLQTVFTFSQTTVKHLRTEHRENPVGIDVKIPRFSWEIQSKSRNMRQTSYEIKIADDKGKDVWNTGKVQSDSSVHVSYKGVPLQSGKKYIWKVRVTGNTGKSSAWSAPATFQMGYLNTADWQAKWIESSFAEPRNRPGQLFRKEFNISNPIKSATANITCHGIYEAYMNGKKIGDCYLTPGWTSYNKRLQYQTYDVTGLLKNGSNTVGAMVGNGWYRSVLGWQNNGNLYGKTLGLLMQIDIEYFDGSTEKIVTDGTWKSSTGEVQYSEIYNGEIIDARESQPGWQSSGFNDEGWKNVKVAEYPMHNLIATYNEPVKAHEILKPVKIFTTPKGEKVIDFGQNLVGWVRMKVKGKTGDSIILRHAEVLDKQGNFYTYNLRAAKATNTYVLSGNGVEEFHPYSSWQGFRFLQVINYPGELTADNFEAVTLYSDMEPSGKFETSNPLINQLQHNIQWGQRGNFLDVPTDCPQRDERLGWTGDAQAFSRTASFNFNVNNFFAKWLHDVEADQIDGLVPHVIPNVLGKDGNSAGWADVATIIPWNMYLAYGDKRIVENQYNSMIAFSKSIQRVAKNDLWNTGNHFGDWLFYRPFDDNDGRSAVTDKNLIAQCFYAHSTQLIINAAKILGKADDVAFYTGLLQRIKDAYLNEYVTPNGLLVSGTQTAYVLALQFNMLPETMRKKAAERLVKNINSYGNHLTTGFLGTPYLCHVLTRFGYNDLAYTLLLKDDYPSWLYPVKQGATTIWERWDGQKPDGTFQNVGMNSFNHYAYGAIGDWMYRKMVGIDTYEDGAGYKHIKIMPHIGGGFTHASASFKTYYGTVSSGWKVDKDFTKIDVSIPANTTATVYLPTNDVNKVTESNKPLNSFKEIKQQGKEEGYIVMETGSGEYSFVIKR